MADMTLCDIKYCKMIPFCQRHRRNADVNPYAQSFLTKPYEDCADKNYQLYIKPEGKNEQ